MLQGKLVRLRAVEQDDLPLARAYLQDPEVLAYFGSYAPMSLADEEDWYERDRKDPTTITFSIEVEGRYVGGCGLSRINARNGNAEIGIFVGDKSVWNKGVGTEAMSLLISYGFDQVNLHRIYLRVFAENTRAIRVYEKLGFQHEGRFRQAEWRHGRWHDLLWMAILRPEWKPDRRSPHPDHPTSY